MLTRVSQSRAYPQRRLPTIATGECFGVSYLNSDVAEEVEHAAVSPTQKPPPAFDEGA